MPEAFGIVFDILDSHSASILVDDVPPVLHCHPARPFFEHLPDWSLLVLMSRKPFAIPSDSARRIFHGLESFLGTVSRVHSELCPICAFPLLYLLQDESPALPIVQKEHHGLWNLCMRHLVAPRRPDEEAELRAQLQRGIDNCSKSRTAHDAALWPWEKDHVTDPLLLFRAFLCIALTCCLYGVDPATGRTKSTVLSRANDPHKRFGSSTGFWPTDPSQLFPYGPAQTIGKLAMGCGTWHDDGPWWILNAVIQLARPRVSDLLFDADTVASRLGTSCLPIIFHGTRFALKTSLDGVTPGSTWQVQTLEDAPWLRSGRGLAIVTALLYTLRCGPYAHPDDMYRFLAPHMPLYRFAFAAAMEMYLKTRIEHWQTLMMCFHPASASVQDARAKVSDAAVLLKIDDEPRGWAVLSVLRLAIQALRADKHCSGPDCTRTTLDEDGERPPLPTCAKCKLARYCGKECQRTDWTRGHKQLCPVFAALERAADAGANGREYALRLQQSAIPDADLALAGRWAATRSKQYMDIVRTDIAFPDMHNTAKLRGGQVLDAEEDPGWSAQVAKMYRIGDSDHS